MQESHTPMVEKMVGLLLDGESREKLRSCACNIMRIIETCVSAVAALISSAWDFSLVVMVALVVERNIQMGVRKTQKTQTKQKQLKKRKTKTQKHTNNPTKTQKKN